MVEAVAGTRPAGAARARNRVRGSIPYRAYNFKLAIQGVTEGHFVECSGLGVRVEPIRYQEGGSTTVHQIPGPIDYGDVTLRYGLTASRELWDWFMAGVQGKVDRRNVSILMLEHGRLDRGPALGPHQRLAVGVARGAARRPGTRGRHRERHARVRVHRTRVTWDASAKKPVAPREGDARDDVHRRASGPPGSGDGSPETPSSTSQPDTSDIVADRSRATRRPVAVRSAGGMARGRRGR